MQSAQMYAPAKRRLMRQSIQMIKPRARALGKKLIQRLPMAAAFFFLSLAQCFSVPSPYALCCLAALLSAGIKPRGALIGLAAGMGIRMLWGIAWDEWQFIFCLVCYGVMRIRWTK